MGHYYFMITSVITLPSGDINHSYGFSGQGKCQAHPQAEKNQFESSEKIKTCYTYTRKM